MTGDREGRWFEKARGRLLVSSAALGAVWWRPGRAFGLIREHRPWALVLLILAISGTIASALLVPHLAQAAQRDLPESASLSDRISVASRITEAARMALVFAPIGIVLRGLLAAGWLWLLIVAMSGRARFSAVFSLLLHAALVPLLQSVVSVAVVLARGVAAVQGAEDLKLSFGLAMLVETENAALRVVVSNFDLFTAWYVVLLAWGVSTVFGLSKQRAAGVAGMYWGSLVLLQAGLAGVADLFRPLT